MTGPGQVYEPILVTCSCDQDGSELCTGTTNLSKPEHSNIDSQTRVQRQGVQTNEWQGTEEAE